MRKLVSILAFSAATLCAGGAFAQMENFGKSGTMGFSAERLFAFYKQTLNADNGQDEEDFDWTGFGFGWGANAYPFNVPRLGFDYFVIDSLSIGGALGYANYDYDDDLYGDDSDESAFVLAPRVGYWIPLGSVAGFWPRGGFTYHSVSRDLDDSDESGLALTLEAMFGIGPAEGFAFLVGPTLDFDFIGDRDTCAGSRGDECDWTYWSIGAQVGIMGWL